MNVGFHIARIGRRAMTESDVDGGLDASVIWWVVFLIVLFLVLSLGVILLMMRCLCGRGAIVRVVRGVARGIPSTSNA